MNLFRASLVSLEIDITLGLLQFHGGSYRTETFRRARAQSATAINYANRSRWSLIVPKNRSEISLLRVSLSSRPQEQINKRELTEMKS